MFPVSMTNLIMDTFVRDRRTIMQTFFVWRENIIRSLTCIMFCYGNEDNIGRKSHSNVDSDKY